MKNKKYILLQIKDICYYDEDFEFDPIIIEADEDFEEKYIQLVEIAKNYEDFEEINDFIEKNFKKIDYTKQIIYI